MAAKFDPDMLNSWITQGQHGKVRRALLALNLARLTRSERVVVADLARRVNMPRMAINVLKPVVKPEVELRPPATVRERALYATALSRVGAFDEAQVLLVGLESSHDPDVLLFRAYNLMFQWNSAAAVPLLRSYVAHPKVSSYAQMTGLVNLASCLNSKGDLAGAKKILNRLFKNLPKENFLLQGNALEIAAHLAVKSKNFGEADKLIREADSFLSGGESRYEIFVKKWRAVVNLMKAPQNSSAVGEVRRLRTEAVAAGNWEVARDLEFFEALARCDDQLFLRVYFGTPYPAYRKRILNLYKWTAALPKNFSFAMGEGSGSPRVVNLSSELKQQPLLAKIFQVVSADLYRPIAVGTVAAKLYPKEYYNPVSSPQKVAQVIKRFRHWLKTHQIPISIVVEKGGMRIQANAPILLALGEDVNGGDEQQKVMEILAAKFGPRPFSATQVAEALSVTKAKALKVIKGGLSRRLLRQTAAGRSSKYKFRS